MRGEGGRGVSLVTRFLLEQIVFVNLSCPVMAFFVFNDHRCSLRSFPLTCSPVMESSTWP